MASLQAQDDLPPYFGINPDQAEQDLGRAMGTAGFRDLAEACTRGRADLMGRGLDERGEKRLRRFSTWEITRYLIPVAQAHFRRVLRQNPDLPQGITETEGGAKWFTLDEVLRLRAHFAAEGSKAKDYRPYRPEGLPAKVVAVANFKGGVGKTSTAAHLAMSAALDGYRVLVIDLDSQGSMTSIFGGRIADEWQTAFPMLGRHYAEYLRAENRARQGRGEAPQALDETLTEALNVSAADLIQTTHWPNIDLIGAQLDLYWAEFQIPVWRMQGRGWKLWDALGERLEADGGAVGVRHRHPRYAARARVSDDQRAGGGRYPAGAAGGVLPRIRLHGAVFRHAPRHLLLYRGHREHRRPRLGPVGDAVRMGRGARGADALRRHPAGRDGVADAGLHGREPQPLAAGFHPR